MTTLKEMQLGQEGEHLEEGEHAPQYSDFPLHFPAIAIKNGIMGSRHVSGLSPPILQLWRNSQGNLGGYCA